MTDFVSFPKIARYSRNVVVTEKIDGTNAQEFLTGSLNRWITPEDDNYGFSRWAHEHKDELLTLGPGRHFGEWWGNGIQRGYGLPSGDKRFSLFNVSRWCLHGQEPGGTQQVLPPCVGLVPLLWSGSFDELRVDEILECLRSHGSYVVPGFMNPEGIVIYHTAGNVCFKKTLEHDGTPKSKVKGRNPAPVR